MSKSNLGDLEQLALLAVVRLGERAYTVGIREEIANRTGRRLNRGAIYATLERLERKGFLRSRFGEPSPERGGKAKKFFRIEPLGVTALETSLSNLQAMREGIDLATEQR